ncbi:MAG: type II toxin-antitoxin system RelE/ParE family toxin [Myxococcales bacterium]
MKLELHSSARRDLDRAAAFYAAEASPVVVARFFAEYDRVVRFLLERPGAGSPRSKGRRSFSLDGFPFSVIYREIADGIRVLVVKHDRQRPDFGGSRR